MTRVVVDANVIVSGFASPGQPPAQVMLAREAGAFALIVSEPLLAEVERTFQKPYFVNRLSQARTQRIIHLLRRRAIIVPITHVVSGVATHPEDDLVLATALSGHASYLVTGDRRLRQIGAFGTITPVTLREYLRFLEHLVEVSDESDPSMEQDILADPDGGL